MEVNQEILRKQIMVSQFCNQVGCSAEQATKILQSARWQIEVAFSLFFQEHGIVSPSTSTTTTTQDQHTQQNIVNSSTNTTTMGSRMSYTCVPTNTPATPPSLPDTLAAFAQMKASSPDRRGVEPRVVQIEGQFGNY